MKNYNYNFNSDIVGGRQIIEAKHYKNGSVYLLDMTNNTLCVLQTNCDNDDLVSRRLFVFSDGTKDEVWKKCKSYYKNIKENLISKEAYD